LENAVELDVLHKYFPVDAVRYFCLREIVFGQDGKFWYEALIDRTNSDLASGLGNLLSRTLTMINRYSDGRVPSPQISEERYLSAKRSGVDPDPQSLASALEHARDQFILSFEEFAFSRAIEMVWSIIARVDKMISDAKPWELAKDDAQRQTLNAVLYRGAETLRWLAVLLYPVMPESSRKIFAQLGINYDPAHIDPAQLQWGTLEAGADIGKVAPIFPRIDKAKTMSEILKESEKGAHATEADAVPGSQAAAQTRPEPPMKGATEADAVPVAAQASPEGVTSMIEIGDFARIDLRVGQIITAERLPKSDKLLRFTVDVGEENPRQILAGIAEHYDPEQLIGRKIIIVANLKPRKLRGFESQGMVLAASFGEEGKPVLATFTEDVPNGAKLK
ncbi:MAG TPA: methionine--tRNA ligase subunit beta, partial [Pyrinomonadaceae bacterium]|nr:methionine--tRNA ligase subunit beta [Pyrinomonadaceae bacterium]